jgi:hypothetical protein
LKDDLQIVAAWVSVATWCVAHDDFLQSCCFLVNLVNPVHPMNIIVTANPN